MSVISFAEVVKGKNSSVRVTQDGLLYAVDLAMAVTGKNRDDAGWVLRHLPEETFPSVKITDRKMPGKGNAHTKLLTFQDAVELVMVLPGKIAKETRTQFANIIKRYLAGDQGLIQDIQANAASDAPLNQAARASVEQSEGQQQVLSEMDGLFSEESLIKRRKLTEEFGESIQILTTQLTENNDQLREQIELKRNFCEVFSKEIELKREEIKIKRDNCEAQLQEVQVQYKICDLKSVQNEMELKYQRDQLAIKKEDLEFRRHLRAFEQSNAVPVASPESTTTVLKVYENNKEHFRHLKHDQVRPFLVKSGVKAVEEYLKRYGSSPAKEVEKGYSVNRFPQSFEGVLKNCMADAHREMTAGQSQPPVYAMWRVS